MKNLLLIILFLMTAAGSRAQSKTFLDVPYIEVAGNADTMLVPDRIFIKINLSEADTRNRQSVEELETKMVNALKALGIDTEKDLTASDLASNFKTYLLKGKEVLKSKQYTLLVRDAVTLAKVFSALESTGIASTMIEKTEHSRAEAVRNLLRTKAILNAKTRAEALTKPLNQTVGAAIHITDFENYAGVIQGSVAGIRIRGTNSPLSDAGYEPAKIEFEKIRIAANITVQFLLKQ
jgi:uncharacterized protein